MAAGQTARVREVLLGQLDHGATGVYLAMDADHKYIYSAPDDRELLFAYDTPVAETRNLAGDPALRPVRARLQAALTERFLADGYLEPLDGRGWRRHPPTAVTGSPDDRDPAGRGRQYALWPARHAWPWSAEARAAVGPSRDDGYAGG